MEIINLGEGELKMSNLWSNAFVKVFLMETFPASSEKKPEGLPPLLRQRGPDTLFHLEICTIQVVSLQRFF